MGAFNRQRIRELHELWEKPRIDGKSIYEFRTSSERISILKRLALNGSEILKNAEHPDSNIRYVPTFCYMDGILSCETTEEYSEGGLYISKDFYAKKRANLLPQFVEVDR